MEPEKSDKKTIGVTDVNERKLGELVSAGHFLTESDAAKFAMAYAIKEGVGRGVTEGAGTKWAVGSFDADQTLKAIVEELYPDEVNPYRQIEHLINAGVALLGKDENLPPDVAGIVMSATKP